MLKPYKTLFNEAISPGATKEYFTYKPTHEEIKAISDVIELAIDQYLIRRFGNKPIMLDNDSIVINDTITAAELKGGWSIIHDERYPGEIIPYHLKSVKHRYKVPLDLFYTAVNENTNNSDKSYLKVKVGEELKKSFTESGWDDIKLDFISVGYVEGEGEDTSIHRLVTSGVNKKGSFIDFIVTLFKDA